MPGAGRADYEASWSRIIVTRKRSNASWLKNRFESRLKTVSRHKIYSPDAYRLNAKRHTPTKVVRPEVRSTLVAAGPQQRKFVRLSRSINILADLPFLVADRVKFPLIGSNHSEERRVGKDWYST